MMKNLCLLGVTVVWSLSGFSAGPVVPDCEIAVGVEAGFACEGWAPAKAPAKDWPKREGDRPREGDWREPKDKPEQAAKKDWATPAPPPKRDAYGNWPRPEAERPKAEGGWERDKPEAREREGDWQRDKPAVREREGDWQGEKPEAHRDGGEREAWRGERERPAERDTEDLGVFLSKHLPMTADYLPKMNLEQRRRLAQEHVAKAAREYRELADDRPDRAAAAMKEFDCELACRLAGQEVRQLRGGGGGREALQRAEEKLAVLVEQLFVVRQAAEMREINALSIELRDLQERHSVREKNKALLIERQRALLSGRPDPLSF